MSIAEAEINVLFEGPSLQPYCMLITITLNDAHSTCVAMYVSSVSTITLNCVFFFSILQTNLTQSRASLIRSVLKGISVNGHVQHLVFNFPYSSLRLHGRCTVR